MLSFGIRFGQGFDRANILKVMQSVPIEFDYDVLVIGSNPGGVACAREASSAGKKTAIIRWQRYSPAEEEGYNENLEEMATTLEIEDEPYGPHDLGSLSTKSESKLSVSKDRKTSKPEKSVLNLTRSGSTLKTRKLWQKTKFASRKVRRSRLDLNNELFKRGQQCRKLMHNASNLGDLISDARNCGWRVVTTTPSLSLNWNKMIEDIMDYVMEENWKLMSRLSEERVEIINGIARFLDNHTIEITSYDGPNYVVSADLICLAPSADYIFPKDIQGAENFGINCDDFYRMIEPPNKTLIVGGTPEALECAGIIAECRFPAVVVSPTKFLKGHDSEISDMIIRDLKSKGVVFIEEAALKSLAAAGDGNEILAKFEFNTKDQELVGEDGFEFEERFDTVLFAVGKAVSVGFLNLKSTGIQFEQETSKIFTDQSEKTSVPNIYALGEIVSDKPENFEITELAGRLLGKRLFSNSSELMDYSMLPSLLLTPREYAFVGLSEDTALYRLGSECVSVFYGSFKPLDFVMPKKNYECFAKVVVFKPKDTVVGLHFYGPDAGETIQGFAAAVRSGITMKQLQTLAGVPTTKAQEILKLKNVKRAPEMETPVE